MATWEWPFLEALTLSRDDGEEYLHRLGHFTKYAVRQEADDHLGIGGYDQNPSEFPAIVEHLIAEPDMYLDAYSIDVMPRIRGITQRDRETVKAIVGTVRNVFSKSGPRLRRRDLEQAIFSIVSHSMPNLQFRNLYDLHRNERLSSTNPHIARVAYDILAAIATIYQVRESWRWRTGAGLFEGHSRDMVEAMHQMDTPVLKKSNQPDIISWAAGRCNVSEMSPRRIIEFRNTPMFSEFARRRNEVRLPLLGESFYSVNQSFFEFLTHEYLPAIRRFSVVESLSRTSARWTKAVKEITDVMFLAAGACWGAINVAMMGDAPSPLAVKYVISVGPTMLAWFAAKCISVPVASGITRSAKAFYNLRSKRTTGSVWKYDYFWRK